MPIMRNRNYRPPKPKHIDQAAGQLQCDFPNCLIDGFDCLR